MRLGPDQAIKHIQHCDAWLCLKMNAALRYALLGHPRTTLKALVAIRDLLTGNAFGALHPDDVRALHAALEPLEQFRDAPAA